MAVGWAGAVAQEKPAAADAPLTAEAILQRVAVNQDQGEAERKHYIYVQHARVTSRKGKTVMCEEITDSRVAPSEKGSYSTIIKLDGRLLRKHKYETYTKLPEAKDANSSKDADASKSADSTKSDKESSQTEKDSSRAQKDSSKADKDSENISVMLGDGTLDRDLVENMRKNLTNDTSRDGIAAHLFPLTSQGQAGYTYRLLGRERMNDRDVFHIEFRPKKKDDFGWKGDAYIDTRSYQPVNISTTMARKIPFAVRTFLGTNLPGLGFTVVYAPQKDGVWFPVSFGTEFKIRVLFFFSREILIDAHNRDFEKTHVTSEMITDLPDAH